MDSKKTFEEPMVKIIMVNSDDIILTSACTVDECVSDRIGCPADVWG